jgi:uncharacterized protein YndB with AHSA1/START domain
MEVRRSVRVRRPVDVAFKVFTAGIAEWWPLREGFSFAPDESRIGEIVLEAREGGRLYERFADGEEYEIGRVTLCHPPERIAFTWGHRDPVTATEVEVTFTADGDGTRVDVVHSGWERLGAKAREAANDYGGGWGFVLSKFEAAA